MKAELTGTTLGVVLDAAEVNEWAARWPCFGYAEHALELQFDARNGDLIDACGDDELDGAGIVALCQDALLASALRLGLDSMIGLHFGPSYIEPMSAREAAEYAPQWGALISSPTEPSAIMYCDPSDNGPAMLEHVESVLIPEADASPYPEHAFDPIQLRRLAAYLKAL